MYVSTYVGRCCHASESLMKTIQICYEGNANLLPALWGPLLQMPCYEDGLVELARVVST